jgi:hypothetical protein
LKICRYHVPHVPQDTTEVCQDCIKHARSIGSEYLNGFVSVLASLVKSNHDLRFLGTNVDYSVKYTGKPQGPVDSDRAITTVLDAIARTNRSRGRAEEQDPDMTPEQMGKARMRSLLFNMTNYHQIHNTLIALCLLRKDRPYLVSHRHQVILNLRPLIAMVSGDPGVTIAVHPTADGGAKGSMAVTKYMQRDNTALALFAFLSGGHHRRRRVHRTNRSGGIISSEAMEVDEEEDEDDEEAKGCDKEGASTIVSPQEHIVVIHGYSFKSERRRTTLEQRESYALAALLLFVPFSFLDAASLLGEHETFQEAFDVAKQDGAVCSEGVQYLRNMELHWQQKLDSQDRTVARNVELRAEAEQCAKDEKLEKRSSRKSVGADANDNDNEKNFRSDSDSDSDMDYCAYNITEAPHHSGKPCVFDRGQGSDCFNLHLFGSLPLCRRPFY